MASKKKVRCTPRTRRNRQLGAEMREGIYRVWFYNHSNSFVMKFCNRSWYRFLCDNVPDDEIDVNERPPVFICEL